MSSSATLRDTAFWKVLLFLMKLTLVVCSVVSTGCIVAGVVIRYILNGDFYGSEEIILCFAFWLYFIGAAYGSYENSHIKADLLNMYLKNMRWKDGMNLLAQLVTVLSNAVLLCWAIVSMQWAIVKWPLTTSLKIPIAIPRAAILVGLLVMFFYHVYYLYDNFRKYKNQGYFSEPGENDYVSENLKKKFPACTMPTKAELEASRVSE